MSSEFFEQAAKEVDQINRINMKPVLNKPEPGFYETLVKDARKHWKALALVAIADIILSVLVFPVICGV